MTERVAEGGLLIQELRNGYMTDKRLAEGALEQLDEGEWHEVLDAESNSVAVIVRHVAGNLRSRFRDFLTSDGEKPDRNRDGEFEPSGLSPKEIMAEWQEGFDTLFGAIDALGPGDLARTITIRGQPHTVLKALLRNYSHTAQHVGQIVMLAKHLRGERWLTLSIPRSRPEPPGSSA